MASLHWNALFFAVRSIFLRPAVSFETMRKSNAQREYQYFRVVITYTDGESSGNRIF